MRHDLVIIAVALVGIVGGCVAITAALDAQLHWLVAVQVACVAVNVNTGLSAIYRLADRRWP